MRICARLACIVGIGAAGAIAACGGSTGDGGSGAEPIPQAELAARAAAAVCDHIGSCCAQRGWAYDAAACRAQYEGVMQDDFIDPAVKAGAIYDAQAAGTCIAGFASLATSCGGGESPDACQRIFTGTKPPGSPCQDQVECAPPANGDVDCTSVGGGAEVCVQEPRGKAGDGCSGTCTDEGNLVSCSGGGSGPSSGPAVCYTNDGLFCGADGKCQTLIPIGGACEYEGCADGAYCLNAACAAKLAAGADCGGDSDACAKGLYCADSKCVAQKPDGASCASFEECLGFCYGSTCTSSLGLLSPGICAGTSYP